MYLIEYGTLDGDGDVIHTYDRDLFCNAICASDYTSDETHRDDIVREGHEPCGIESDTNVYCPTCGAMLEHGLEQAADFDCTDPYCQYCPPLVVNLVAPYEHDERCDNCGCVQYQGKD